MASENSPAGRSRRSFIEEARRRQILEAAVLVVGEAGYAGTSLARIAQKAGISKSVISYHFSGKEEILRLVVSEFFERVWQHMEARIRTESTATGAVHAWIEAQTEFFGAHRTEFLAMNEVVMNHRNPDGSLVFAEGMAEEVDGLTEILAWGQRDGEFRDFAPRTVANIILRCADGVLGSWLVDDAVDLPKQTAALLDFIDHAIQGAP
ncbi:TetR/AcrR family transcriptional regulator [Actinomadura sp. KC345]|uniref:TetR/AcrR family transcriptional regulator n=1 Tax=Actinomadura sp. KC345 TaxID=2530371 RepID=UPI001047C8B6|nr:TetR/AcrR family transcriptional regulator [Actinomadura sp. KC345]TDC47749.1 TetR/AcrR family transcriptional regulator [Actinomadura sp. KC345]